MSNDRGSEMDKQYQNYTVTMSFKFPSWDEREGYEYTCYASSKADAIKQARRRASDDGHMGQRSFRAAVASQEDVTA